MNLAKLGSGPSNNWGLLSPICVYDCPSKIGHSDMSPADTDIWSELIFLLIPIYLNPYFSYQQRYLSSPYLTDISKIQVCDTDLANTDIQFADTYISVLLSFLAKYIWSLIVSNQYYTATLIPICLNLKSQNRYEAK